MQQAEQEQDRTLVDIEKGLDNLKVIGQNINHELHAQERLLTELDTDMSGVTSRTSAANKKVSEIKRRLTGTTSQIATIIGLLAVVATLAYLVFK